MMKRAHGFTLIELMVGVALGLLATLVISQVFLQYEGNKRASTSGSDAQVAGAVALFALQRDIQGSGYGLSAWPEAMGCALSAQYDGAVALNPATDVLAPVIIGFGATAADSDSITVMASGKLGYSVPSDVTAAHAQIDSVFTVLSSQGVAVGDLMLAAPPLSGAGVGCTLFMATAVTATTVSHTAAGSPKWNGSTAIFPTSYASGSVLLNMGPNPIRRRYSVNPTSWSLQVQELLTSTGATTAQELFPQVVLVKALYGKSITSAGPVVTYSTTPPVLNADWRLVRAVRVVVVARSAQYERDVVTSQLVWDLGPLTLDGVTNAKTGVLSTCNTTNQCVTLDVSASGPSNAWQHYRYKVFDTVIPLRNMVWNP